MYFTFGQNSEKSAKKQFFSIRATFFCESSLWIYNEILLRTFELFKVHEKPTIRHNFFPPIQKSAAQSKFFYKF